ncbi:hypothetical protein B0H14DRAFT_3448940 [Mycena olivaceomarginata]|nr:hypothetical protein B0H14DRAFT_3448940 [Mycena olivaceomarginata]
MAIAKDTMISTPELLEQTLTHPPMRDLPTVAPLVSRTWQTIPLSSELQRALFFEPDASVTEPVENPLLAALFPPFFVGPGPDAYPSTASAFKAMPWATAPVAFQRADASWHRMPPETLNGGGVLEDTVGLRMGMLYDLVVPFVDAGGSFCLRWHDGLNGEGDLALTLWESMGCTSDFEEHLGELFGSEGWKEVEIIFGQSREIGL